MFGEQQQQQRQQQQQQQQVNNQNRLSNDWFYSSVMLADRLDICEHTGTAGYNIGHLKASNQTSLSGNNLLNPELLNSKCQYSHASNEMYPTVSATSIASSSSSSSSSSAAAATASPFQPPNSGTTMLDDKTIQIMDMQIKDPVCESIKGGPIAEVYLPETFCKLAPAISSQGYTGIEAQCANSSTPLHTQCRSRSKRRTNVGKLRITCSSSSIINRKKDDMREQEQEQKRIEEGEGGKDGAGDEVKAPPNVLYSHSTTNSSDKMKWDCGAGWPSASRTGMLTSPHAAPLIVDDMNDKANTPHAGTTLDTTITSANTGTVDLPVMDVDSGFCSGSSPKLIQENGSTGCREELNVTTNGGVDGAEGTVISKAKVQRQDKCNFTDAATAVGAASGAQSSSSAAAVVPHERPSTTASIESSSSGSSPSIKVPIKKRLQLHSSGSPAPVLCNGVSAMTNTHIDMPPNMAITLPEHQQNVPTTMASVTTGKSCSVARAFSSCTQMTATGHTDIVVGDDSAATVVTASYPKPVTNCDVYGSMSNDRIDRTVPNPALSNNLSEAELISLLRQNVCDIEHIVAQQRIASSGTAPLQPPSSLLSFCSGEQQPQTSCRAAADPMTVPDEEQQPQQQQHSVANERRRSDGAAYSSETRRFHPYATTIAATTSSCSSGTTTFWSPSAPSRADLKQKHLRSLAPVLYDLLSDDCDSENCRKTTDPMDYSILKNCMESSVNSYFRSLSLLAATASLPIISNKIDQLPLNYVDYFTLQQYNLLLGSAPVTSTDLLKLAQSANLLYSFTGTTPTTNQGTVFPDTITYSSEDDQHSGANAINGSCSQPSQQPAMLIVDNEPSR